MHDFSPLLKRNQCCEKSRDSYQQNSFTLIEFIYGLYKEKNNRQVERSLTSSEVNVISLICEKPINLPKVFDESVRNCFGHLRQNNTSSKWMWSNVEVWYLRLFASKRVFECWIGYESSWKSRTVIYYERTYLKPLRQHREWKFRKFQENLIIEATHVTKLEEKKHD